MMNSGRLVTRGRRDATASRRPRGCADRTRTAWNDVPDRPKVLPGDVGLSLSDKALTIQRTRPLSSPGPPPRLRYGWPEIRPCSGDFCRNPEYVQKGGPPNGTRNR